MPAAWQAATVVAIRDETPSAKTFRLALDAATGHRAGQHYVVRLTAPDGYTASRSYSVASAPDGSTEFELTVERFDDGEVSTFLHDVVEVGDELEVRGPIGGYFVWEAATPALLLAGGSGVVPLMAMLRLARAPSAALISFTSSCRSVARATSTTPTSCRNRMRPSSTRATRRRRRRVSARPPHRRRRDPAPAR